VEELLDWIVTVEEVLEFKHVPLDRCVLLSQMRFRNRAAAWWTQLKAKRARLGKPKIIAWDRLKGKLRKTFLPYNYDQIMFQRLQSLRQGSRSVEEYSTEFFFFSLVLIFMIRINKSWLASLVVSVNRFNIHSICLIHSHFLKHINKPLRLKLRPKALFLLGVFRDLLARRRRELYHHLLEIHWLPNRTLMMSPTMTIELLDPARLDASLAAKLGIASQLAPHVTTEGFFSTHLETMWKCVFGPTGTS
jgi:hypothetical protein